MALPRSRDGERERGANNRPRPGGVLREQDLYVTKIVMNQEPYSLTVLVGAMLHLVTSTAFTEARRQRYRKPLGIRRFFEPRRGIERQDASPRPAETRAPRRRVTGWTIAVTWQSL